MVFVLNHAARSLEYGTKQIAREVLTLGCEVNKPPDFIYTKHQPKEKEFDVNKSTPFARSGTVA